jgi:hypothetical protein
MTKWTDFVKAFAKKHNLSYGCALSDVRCREEYHYYKTADLKPTEKKKSKKVILSEQKSKKVNPILEIQELPKTSPKVLHKISKPILKIPEKWLEYMKLHNIPDFFQNKNELNHRYTEDLIGIAEYFGLKVPKNVKHSDREKIINTIVNYTTLPEIQEILEKPEIPKQLDFPRKFFNLIKGNDLSIEDGLKDRSIISYITNNDLIKIANILGVKVSKYDDKETLVNKILDYTTNLE